MIRSPRPESVEFRITTGSFVRIVTAGIFGSVLLQLPLYVPPEVIEMAVGSETGETNTNEEALLPPQVAVTEEEPMPTPTNSPLPFDDSMAVSAAFQVQREGEIVIVPSTGVKRTSFPCGRLVTDGESCNTP